MGNIIPHDPGGDILEEESITAGQSVIKFLCKGIHRLRNGKMHLKCNKYFGIWSFMYYNVVKYPSLYQVLSWAPGASKRLLSN